MQTYIVSDLHLNHDKIKTYCRRPDNFTDLIIRNWRQIVKPEDLVICLGDVFIGPVEGWRAIYPQLTGRKILVRGNHDRRHSCSWWMQNGWAFCCDSMIYRNCWLTHEPAQSLPEGTDINIHGHLHNIWDGFFREHNIERDKALLGEDYLKRLKYPWQRLFAIEYTGYGPVNFDKFVSHPDRYQARGPKNVEADSTTEALV